MTKVSDILWEPLKKVFNVGALKNIRKCPVINDFDFIKIGCLRVLEKQDTGRGFVQKILDYSFIDELTVSNFFKSLSSERRLELCKETNNSLIKIYENDLNDPFKVIPELDDYAIYAADGHFHQHATHEAKHKSGKYYPTGHIYAFNLRTRFVQHLDILRPDNKKENEIHALKRLGGKVLRMGEPTGRKVVMIYDRACIDFEEWYKWKQSKGVYVVTLEKCNMRLDVLYNIKYDKNNPINIGIISDQCVGHSKGSTIRKIKYIDPITKKQYSFITNIMNISPGVIAFMYKKRWEIEDVYKNYKCVFEETKAWAKSECAKCIQANLLCIMLNLLTIFSDKLEKEEGIVDIKVIKRQMKNKEKEIQILKEKSLPINPLIYQYYRCVIFSLQFIRKLRAELTLGTLWRSFISNIRPLMRKYLL